MRMPLSLPDPERHRSWVLAAALLLPPAASAALTLVRASTDSAVGALVLVLVVVSVAAAGLRLAGVLAALSSGLWFDVFLTHPYGQLRIDDPDDVEVTVLLVLIGLVVTEVALWGRRQAAASSRRAGYLSGVLRTAELVIAPHDSSASLTTQLSDQLTEILRVDSCRYVPGPTYDDRYAVLSHDGSVTRGGRQLDVERFGLPTDEYTVLHVVYRGATLGHFLFTSASRVARPTVEQRRVAVLLTDQLAPVLHDG